MLRTPIGVAAVTRQLVLSECALNDKDCHTIAGHLPLFRTLLLLDLSGNRITSAGVSSLVASLFSCGSHYPLRSWSLERNRIDRSGAAVIAEALRSGSALLQLQSLTLSGNPITDSGLFTLLKSLMNPHRRAYHRIAQSMHGRGEGDYAEEEEEVDEDAQKGLRATPRGCYFEDYFHPPLTEDALKGLSGSSPSRASWFSAGEESFWMETKSCYSSSHEDFEEESEEELEEKERRKLLQRAKRKTAEVPKKTPILVALLLKVRLKLVALSAFSRLRSRGHLLSSLEVSHCSLSAASIAFLVPILVECSNIDTIDVSQNRLLASRQDCATMANAFKHARLRNVKLNDCNIDEAGLQELAKGIIASQSLRSIQLAGNNFGPTGANWISAMSKQYFIDLLELKNGTLRIDIRIYPLLVNLTSLRVREGFRQKKAPFGTPSQSLNTANLTADSSFYRRHSSFSEIS